MYNLTAKSGLALATVHYQSLLLPRSAFTARCVCACVCVCACGQSSLNLHRLLTVSQLYIEMFNVISRRLEELGRCHACCSTLRSRKGLGCGGRRTEDRVGVYLRICWNHGTWSQRPGGSQQRRAGPTGSTASLVQDTRHSEHPRHKIPPSTTSRNGTIDPQHPRMIVQSRQ